MSEPTIPHLNPSTQVVPESSSEDAFCHELDEGCPCGPTVEPVKRDDGSVGWVLIHHSLDGRENAEGGER
jgi:hypothetical protein